MWVWSCERMHVCPHVNTRDRDWWWAVIINMFLKALHPIHVPLAPCNEAHCFESIHQSHSVERCWKWTDAALPRWPNSPHAGGGSCPVNTLLHQYLSYEVTGSNSTWWALTVEPMWVNRAAGESQGCCFLSDQNICSVVTDRPIPSPPQTALTGLLSAGFVQPLHGPLQCLETTQILRGPSPGHSNKNNSRGINLPL